MSELKYIYKNPLLFKFRSFMELVCHMIQREFLAASTLSSWLSLDYRFVMCIRPLLSLFCNNNIEQTKVIAF